MEETLLLDLLLNKLYKYREELEKADDFPSKSVKISYEALAKSLNKEQLVLLDEYKTSVVIWQEMIEIQFGVRLTNLAVNLGMQIQKAIDEEKD